MLTQHSCLYKRHSHVLHHHQAWIIIHSSCKFVLREREREGGGGGAKRWGATKLQGDYSNSREYHVKSLNIRIMDKDNSIGPTV